MLCAKTNILCIDINDVINIEIHTKTDVSNDSSTVMFDMNAGSADIDL